MQLAFNLVLIILASLYLGMLIGKRGVKVAVDRAVKKTVDEVRAREAALATELGTELGKIRESIIVSAKAYQGAIRAVEERLSAGAQFTIGDTYMERLPESIDILEPTKADSRAEFVIGGNPAFREMTGRFASVAKSNSASIPARKDEEDAAKKSGDEILPRFAPPENSSVSVSPAAGVQPETTTQISSSLEDFDQVEEDGGTIRLEKVVDNDLDSLSNSREGSNSQNGKMAEIIV